MKRVYYFTRRQFGKVLTPLKVYSARLPVAFGTFCLDSTLHSHAMISAASALASAT